jgi:hypothetical protein
MPRLAGGPLLAGHAQNSRRTLPRWTELLGVSGGLELDHEFGWDAAAFLDVIALVLGPVAYL